MSSQAPAVLLKNLFQTSSIHDIQNDKASKLREITSYNLEPMLPL